MKIALVIGIIIILLIFFLINRNKVQDDKISLGEVNLYDKKDFFIDKLNIMLNSTKEDQFF